MKGLNKMMQQAQKMQEEMQQAQQEIAKMEISAESGAGMVKVVMNGQHRVKQVNIDPSLLTEEKELLEDLVAAAINAAVEKVERESKEKMSGLTSGLNIPGGFGSLFGK